MPVHEFVAEARGVGRVDYSAAIEMTTEPVISSWQKGYSFCGFISVPAESDKVIDIPIEEDLVVILYDFFASIPSNRLIRLRVDSVDSLGVVLANVVDRSRYQTIAAHIAKGYFFAGFIRFIVHNYAPTAEDFMTIGATGMYTTLQEFKGELV